MRVLGANALGRMKQACKELLAATPEGSAWTWDDDYYAALLVIHSPDESDVQRRLGQILPHSWDQLEVSTAPEHVRHVCGVWGGLMARQRLFVLEPDDDPMLFASWWPWGNRLKFSLRLGCYGRNDMVVKADPQAKMRAFMGV